MLHGRMKRGAAFLLAFCLIFTAAQWQPYEAKAAEGENLARLEGVTATASNSESGTSFTPEKVIDGNKDNASRWATDTTETAGQDSFWLQLAWPRSQTVQSFVITWQRRTAQTLRIDASSTGIEGSWQEIYSRTTIPGSKEERIALENSVSAKYIRFSMSDILANCPDDESDMEWPNVAILEIEAYDGEIPDGRSEAQKIADGIEAPVIGDRDAKISIPEAPEGVEISFRADYEQVIGGDGTIYRPLETRTVKGFYEITCPASAKEPEGSLAQTAEFEITVPGRYEAQENGNAKPAVIPELQEWHAGEGEFLAGSAGRIIVKDNAFSDVADAFAKDYKEMTGLDISVVTDGSQTEASAGDFVLSAARADSGLGKEGYTMDIGDFVAIEAEQATGAYWATRTILQILKRENGMIPKGIVRDYPKYEVRGFSLDVGRKPFTLETLYEFAENMAWYKMNSFQVHLSDNLIFHEDYPTLEEAAEQSYAGNRLQSDLTGSTGKTSTAEDVFYTKADFKTFIQDSRGMGVDIVPEFDMPAHALPWTRAFPEYQAKRAGGSHSYLIEELDLSLGSQVDEWAKSVWNEYFEDGIFDEEMTVHIGTDEYHGTDGQQGREEFRRFSAALINFVQSKGRTVRMWGSLTNKAGETPVPSEGVQLNIWNTGYANPSDMYNLGYDLINTLEGPNYIVPAAGYYNDYINANNIYSSWQPNVIGNLTMKPGDGQMLGGCYAIWHDSVDTRANGISQYDSFDRFFQALPAYGAKLWGDAKDRDYNEFSQVFAEIGTAPGTTIAGDVASVSSTVASYDFEGNEWTKDSGVNGYDLEGQKNVSQTTAEGGKSLKLNGGESYVETPLDQIGSNAVLTMKVKMDQDAEGEQILCESKEAFGTYGTYAFKASQKNTGKVGFSREGYDYSFNYTLPKNQWVTLEFRSGKDVVELYVDGELADNNPDIYFANHETTELSAKLTRHNITKIATMLVPFGRIGSKTTSFKGEIDYVTVTSERETSGEYGKIDRTGWTTDACSTHAGEGSQAATLDGQDNTYWHQDYGIDVTGAADKDKKHPNEPHWFEVTLPEPATVAKLSYLPRQDSSNGRILEYSVVATTADGEDVTVVDHGEWLDNASLKTAVFSPVEAKKIRLLIHESVGGHATIAEINLYGEISVSALKTELQDLLDRCTDYGAEDYTEITWNAFSDAMEAANRLVSGESGVAEDYISAMEQLEAAERRLVRRSTDRRLFDLIKEGDLKESQDYAKTGYDAYQAKVNAAKELADTAAEDAKKAAADAIEEAKAALVYIGELRGEYANASKIDQEEYVKDANLTAFQEAIAAADTALKNADVTKEAVVLALNGLRETQKKLVTKLDAAKERLKEAAEGAKEKLADTDWSQYTSASKKALEDAIAAAEAELGNASATADTLAAKLAGLDVALVKKDPEAPAEKEKLRDAVTEALKQLEGWREDAYTEESVARLRAAAKAANDEIENEDATKETLAEKLTALKDVVLVPKDEGVFQLKDALDEEIAKAEQLLADIEKENYTAESVEALEAAIASAKEELSKTEVTSGVLNGLLEKLKGIRLETPAEVSKKTELSAAADAAVRKELKDTRYTATSLNVLRDAVKNAQKLVASGASVEKLQEALNKLESAKKNLKLKSYVVTFNSHGGSAVSKQTVTIGQKAKAPANPRRTGYVFDGWYADAFYRTKYNFAASVTKALTLHAKWKEQDPFADGAMMTDAKKKITYKVISAQNKTAMVFKGNNKKAASVAIPATVIIHGQTCKVVTVGTGAFQGYNKMTKVTLGKNVTAIEKNAFAKCKKLKTVTMKGKALVSVKPGAFKNTAKNLTVKAPKGMKKAQKDKLLKNLKKGGNKKVKVK